MRSLRHQGMFKNYRVCPSCNELFTVDSATKRRQAAFIVVALISLALTLLLCFSGQNWLVPALASYATLAGLIYWGNRHVFFVPYSKPNRRDT